MDHHLLKEYARLDEVIKMYEEQKAAMREEILLDMKKHKMEKVKSEYGNFTVGHRNVWTYSAKVTALEEKVKIAKVKEQEKGIAKTKVTNYLVFSKPSEDDEQA